MVGGIVLVAGALKALSGNRRFGPAVHRDRITEMLRQWEERFRKRYKRR
jgi:hypothetical protein